MARNSMNFQVKAGLETKGFRKGVNELRSMMGGLRASFASLATGIGLGLGFKELLSGLKNTSIELDTAINTLRNVSKETTTFKMAIGEVEASVSSFNENMEFLREISDKYGQDLIALTDGFAKFKAASSNAGISLQEQQYIFEQLTRAAAHFHMSADQTSNMMLAITQMFSKGTVQSQELRLQLGNALPGALNIMAKALGVTTSELGKMITNGEVLANDAVPKFAKELENITKNSSFESLQLSLNRFKNAWYDLTTNSGFADFFKKGVDIGTSAIKTLSDNFNHFLKLLLSLGTLGVFNRLKAEGDAYIAHLQSQLVKLENTINSFSSASAGKARKGVIGGKFTFYSPTDNLNETSLRILKEHNNKLLEMYNIRKQLYGQKIFSDYELKKLKVANRQFDTLTGTAENVEVSMSALGTGFKNFAKTAGTALKSIAKATFWTAIIQLVYEGITYIWDSINKTKDEAEELRKEIENIYKEYDENVKNSIDSAEKQVEQARFYLSFVKDITKTESARKLALEKLADLVGDIEIKNIDISNINDASEAYRQLADRVEEWAEAHLKAAAIEVYAQEYAEAEVKKKRAQQRVDEIDLSGKALSKEVYKVTGYTESIKGGIYPTWGYTDELTDIGKERAKLVAEIAEHERVMANAKSEVNALGAELSTMLLSGDSGGGGGDDVEGLAKIYQDYLKKLKELKNQLKEGAITKAEYDENLKKYIEQTFASASATGELSVLDLLQKQDSGKVLTAMEKWYLDIATKAKDSALNAMFDEADALLKKLNDEIDKDIENLLSDNSSIKEMEDRVKGYAEYLAMIPNTFAKQRNDLFDYNKSKSDILGEKYDIAADRVSGIEDIIEKLQELQLEGHNVTNELARWSEELKRAEINADSFARAADLAKLREDIESLSEELAFGIYGGITGFVNSIDGMVSAFERLQATIDDVDARGWEQFMAVFSTFTSILDTGIGLYETINGLMAIGNALKGAEASEQIALNAAKSQELITADALVATKAADVGVTTTATAAKTAQAIANAAAATTASDAAIAGATASAAAVPFPYNLVAIPQAVGAVLAALSTMAMFADGGIVGGNSKHGDRNVVRVNSGEMILNKHQQGTLWSMLNGQGGIGGNVNFKIKGSDLIGVISNENSRRRG